MEPLQLAICDDQPEEQDMLLSLLNKAPVPTVCTAFSSGEALLDAFRPGVFDLLLMDIYMDGMTGVETARAIRKLDRAIPIAFVTASTDHALEGYRLSVLRYLEKPIFQEELNDLLRLVKAQQDHAPRLTVRQNGAERSVLLSDLLYLEQQGHHVILALNGRSSDRVYGKLSDLLPQLNGEPFFCPHKSYCVNLAYVRSWNRDYQCFELVDGKKVPISRPNRRRAKEVYEDFLFARTRGNG